MATIPASGAAASSGSASASMQIDAPSSYKFLLRPEVPFKQIVEFKTNIMRSSNGTEQRVGLRLKPRERYEWTTILPTENEIRRWHKFLANATNAQLTVPIWQHQVTTTAEAASGATTILGDFSFSDLANGDLVALIPPQGAEDENWEAATIDTIAAGQITVSAGIGNMLPKYSTVVPTRLGRAQTGIGYNRGPVNAAVFPVSVTLENLLDLGGAGGATLNTYRSITLLDRRPHNNSPLQTTFHQDTERTDFGNKFVIQTAEDPTRIHTVRQYLIETRSEKQWWAKFLMGVLGRREPFFTATYRPNLVPISNTASTILITDNNDYKVWYEDHGSKEDIQVETDSATSQHRITSSVDNMDGTITLNVDGTIVGTVAVVSFLEVSRLVSDTIVFEHYGNYSRVSISVSTLDESQT